MQPILGHIAIGSFEEGLAPPPAIEALLCVAEEKDIAAPERLYAKVPLRDMTPIPAEGMVKAVTWLRDHRDRRVLVFCNAGVGRSPSVVVGYLYCVLGFGYGEAVEFVARRKPYMSTLPCLIETVEQARNLMA